MYALGFFLQSPDYICTDVDGSTRACKAEEICIAESDLTWQVNWDSERSFENWRVKFDLTCAESWVIALPGMLYFIGLASTTLWLPSFSDMYGRRLYFLIAMLTGLAFNFGMFITQNWIVLSSMAFLLGFVTSLRLQVGFNYLIEFVPRES